MRPMHEPFEGWRHDPWQPWLFNWYGRTRQAPSGGLQSEYVTSDSTEMEDPYGFMRLPRREPGKERVPLRIRHWREYVHIMPDAQAAGQANRCMDCGIPYCHRFCPVHNLIPDWNALVSEESWQLAWQHLESTNNFP